MFKKDDLLFCKRQNDEELNSHSFRQRWWIFFIRYFHEGPIKAYQAAKETAANIIRTFFWPDLKMNVR